MCRAVGIPARVVTGIVYVSELAARKDVFCPHAWTEVFIDDKWIGLDATKQQGGFSPYHIAMATGNGDPFDFSAMTTTLGYFKIEKIITDKD